MGWEKRNRSRILGILPADFKGKQSDGSVTSWWSTPVLYKSVREAEIGPRGTIKRWPCHCMVSGAQSWVLGNFPLSQLSDGNIFPEQFRAEVDPFFPILLRSSAFLDNSWKSLPSCYGFSVFPQIYMLRCSSSECDLCGRRASIGELSQAKLIREGS